VKSGGAGDGDLPQNVGRPEGSRSLLSKNHNKAALENPTMSTSLRWTAVLSFGSLLLASYLAAVPAEGAGSSSPAVPGVPGHWINPSVADDPVEQFVVHKSTPAQPQPAMPTANEVRHSPDVGVNVAAETVEAKTTGGEAVAVKRSAARAPVSWSSLVPSSVLWAGAGVCGVCLIALTGWQWLRFRRRRDVPEVAVLSLAAFQQSSRSVPQSASSDVRRKAA